MRNIKLIIEYDGTNYHGWQSQINAVAIQDIVSGAVRKLTGETCTLIGSGRTDAGVHALGQVANFHTNSGIPPERFSYALNSVLPKDIVIRHSEEAASDFHARFSARGKTYIYLIFQAEHPSALLRNRACHVPYVLDDKAMCEAAGFFTGTHDFSAFRASGSSTETSVRTMTQAIFREREDFYKSGRLFEFRISGDGFLYNMVRIMAGTLIEVGLGKIPPGAISEIIRSVDRAKAGKTAPARGLYLVEVEY